MQVAINKECKMQNKECKLQDENYFQRTCGGVIARPSHKLSFHELVIARLRLTPD